MARLLFAWELGGGFGHIVTLGAVATALRRRGHVVNFAVRHPADAAMMLQNTGIDIRPAPFMRRKPIPHFSPAGSYAQLLHNVSFADGEELDGRTRQWESIFRDAKPDMLVVNHAPTALLAARGLSFAKVSIGTGFCSPPRASMLPLFPRSSPTASSNEELTAHDKIVLETVNVNLASRGAQLLARLSDLFNDIDECFLATFPELDHFGHRPDVRYWGNWPYHAGTPARWPPANGSKVLIYLKPTAGVPHILESLSLSRLATLAVIPGCDPNLVQRWQCDTLTIRREPIELNAAFQDCNYAILNGGHGVTATALRHGKPVLLYPIHVEHLLMARMVEKTGAGFIGHARSSGFACDLQRLLSDNSLLVKAQAFAGHYADWSTDEKLAALVDGLDTTYLKSGR